jgi:hypothetical protein
VVACSVSASSVSSSTMRCAPGGMGARTRARASACMHVAARTHTHRVPSSSCTVSPAARGTNANPHRVPCHTVTAPPGGTPPSPSTAEHASGSRALASPKWNSDTRRKPLSASPASPPPALPGASVSSRRTRRMLTLDRSAGDQACPLRSCTHDSTQGGRAHEADAVSPAATICSVLARAPAKQTYAVR